MHKFLDDFFDNKSLVICICSACIQTKMKIFIKTGDSVNRLSNNTGFKSMVMTIADCFLRICAWELSPRGERADNS